MLDHGGRLRTAARQYGIALDDWIDLSTAINPRGYLPPPIDAAAWLRLPENDDGLEAAAAAYYGNPNLLVLPGSQAAIQAMPRIVPRQRVGVLQPGYNEHTHCWRKAGHAVIAFAAEQLEAIASQCDTVVLCNPNNPDAGRIAPERLQALAASGKQIVIDEAFADATPALSMLALAGSSAAPNLIVLRSFGKFFGLAGARVGFAFATAPILAALADEIGPWAVAGPSRAVATAALRDADWQAHTRLRLASDSARLAVLLAPLGSVRILPLFVYVACSGAEECADFFARRGILLRHFEHGLRCGLPADESDWLRLSVTINEWSNS